MTWFAFNGYPDMSLAGEQEKSAAGIGFHGYATQAEADAHPNSVNIFQAGLLNILEADYSEAVKEGATPGGPNNLETLGGVGGAIVQGAGANLSGLIPTQVTQFFSNLTSATLWLRIGEGLLGIVLLAVGIARLTHAVPVATSIAKTAGAVALA